LSYEQVQRSEEMRDLKAVARKMSQEEIFQSIGYAALKARAGRLQPGDIVKIGGLEFVMAEDEEGEGVVAQIIVGRGEIEGMAVVRARENGLALEGAAGKEMMGSLLVELGDILERWQGIKLRAGPGENITLEKAAYKRDRRPW
jgi:hypothetical protein